MNIDIERIIKLSREEQKILIKQIIKIVEYEIYKQEKDDFTEYLIEREEVN